MRGPLDLGEGARGMRGPLGLGEGRVACVGLLNWVRARGMRGPLELSEGRVACVGLLNWVRGAWHAWPSDWFVRIENISRSPGWCVGGCSRSRTTPLRKMEEESSKPLLLTFTAG